MRKSLVAACIALNVGTIFAPAPARADDLPALVAAARPAVVTIQVETERGRSAGTGFLIAPGRILTSYHVLEGASAAQLRTVGGEELQAAGIVASDAENDLAVLAVEWADAPAPLRVAADLPREGERIVVIGTPRGLEFTVSDGIVAGIRDSLVQVTAPVSPGSSGGPVISMNGEVIGIIRHTRLDGQNLNFAVSSPLVHMLEYHEPRTLAGNVPRRTTSPALWRPDADRPAVSPDILQRLRPAHRTWVRERAADLLWLPGGVVLDIYRLNRLREVEAGATHRTTAGVDRMDHLLYAQDSPPLLLPVVSGEDLDAWGLHIEPRLDLPYGPIAPIPPMRVERVLPDGSILATPGGGDLFHFRGPFGQEPLHDNDVLTGDYLLQPAGVFTYTVSGRERTAASFQFWRFDWLTLSPAHVAAAIEDSHLTLQRHRIETTARRTIVRGEENVGIGGGPSRITVGGSARWRTDDLRIVFAPENIAEAGERPATVPQEHPPADDKLLDELHLHDGRTLRGEILEERGMLIRFHMISRGAAAELDIPRRDIRKIVRSTDRNR